MTETTTQTRYDWNDPRVPKWANWMATDKTGTICAFQKEPELTDWGFDINSIEEDVKSISYNNDNKDWQNSLEQRPQNTQQQ